MRISVFGLGYVGSVSCAAFAKLGHQVIGVDINQAKVDAIKKGRSPVVEPGLDELIQELVKNRLLSATSDHNYAIENSELAIICVGTPAKPTGQIDVSSLNNVLRQIAESLKINHHSDFFLVINRSTTTPEYQNEIVKLLEEYSGKKSGIDFGYVFHPEFLREGSGLEDFFNPTRVIFGVSDNKSRTICERLYPNMDADMFFVLPEEAAMVKYADNAFHSLKVTFANEIGMICNKLGIDARVVMDLVCKDTKLNISPKYLSPGLPFGGSCLPKDLSALLDLARKNSIDLPLLSGMSRSNELQLELLFKRVISEVVPCSKIGVIGLTFKETTDDLRGAPMVKLVELLIGKGYEVMIFDRVLSLQKLVGANRNYIFSMLPHISKLIRSDLQRLISESDLVIINHRMKPDIWNFLDLPEDIKIMDLVGVDELERHPGYMGIYW